MHRTCPELEVSGVTTGNGPPAAIMKRLVLGTSRLEMGAGGCVSANSAASSTTSAATHPSLQLTLCPHHSHYASSHTETRQVASPLATTSMMPFFFAASASEETFQAQARLFSWRQPSHIHGTSLQDHRQRYREGGHARKPLSALCTRQQAQVHLASG